MTRRSTKDEKRSLRVFTCSILVFKNNTSQVLQSPEFNNRVHMKNIKKILFLNQMAGPLFFELAVDLSITCSRKSELYTGYPDTLKRSDGSDTLIISSAPPYNTRSNLTRLWSWCAYAVSAWLKVLFASKGTLVFVVSNPPLMGPLVFMASRIRKLPYVVLIYDMHPDTMINFGLLKERSILVRIWRYFNKLVWENAEAVFTIGTVMAEKLADQFVSEKTQLGYVGVVPPWADTEKIRPLDKCKNPLIDELGQVDCITVLYSGNMGKSHDIVTMLNAAKVLSEHKKIKFLFIGGGDQWQTAFDFVSEKNLENVQVLPFQSESRLPFTMALSDISLVSLDRGAEGLMVPSKMYYYMAAGSAIIGVCEGKNDLEASLKIAECGRIVEPGAVQCLAKIILELASDVQELERLKIKARDASVSFFSRDVCVEKFRILLSTLKL